MVVCDNRLFSLAKQNVKNLLTYDVKQRAVYSKDDHLKLLLTASFVNGFAEGISRFFDSMTAETLLSYIKSQEQQQVQSVFDRLVEQNITTLKRRRKFYEHVAIAIDWHDVMYYGDPETPMVVGTQHKKGSNYAYQYLTASILSEGKRFVVAVAPMSSKSEVSDLTIGILLRIEQLGIRIKYVTFDGGFYNADTIRFLEAYGLKYIIRMPMTSKAKKMKLWNGRRFRYTTNSHKRKSCEQVSFDVVVAYDERKKYKYLFATNIQYCASTILNLFLKRWGIETSYRMCNQFLIKTTSKNYIVRLFYYLLACAVYNFWVLYNTYDRVTVVQMKLTIIGLVINEIKELPT